MAVVLVLSLGAGAQVGPAVARDDCVDIQAEVNDVTGKKIVLVTHGWRGEELSGTRQMLDDKLDDTWVVRAFNYPSRNLDWPGGSGVDKCLRDHIKALRAASGMTVANIYLVGHSMGGILARFALDPARDSTIRTAVAGVVTLDTPHQGSPLGGSLAAAAMVEFTGDGWDCLSLHHPGVLPPHCEHPPLIPSEIPVSQIGGNVTLTRAFFHFFTDRIETNGDGIVWIPSQTGYVSSADQAPTDQTITSQRVNCEHPVGALAYAGLPMITWGYAFRISEILQTGDAELASHPHLLAVSADIAHDKWGAECGHSKVVTHAPAIDAIAEALKKMPLREPRWTIDPDGVGPLKFDQTISSLPDAVRQGFAREYPCPPNYTSPDGWRVSVVPTEFDGEVMASFVVWWSGAEPGRRAPVTDSGITLGSSESEVLAAFPDAIETQSPYLERTDYVADYHGTSLAIGTSQGRVDVLALNFESVPPELCG